ncbi:MAG: AMP-binding protein [Bauldia sp.]|uniref:class I adenylate-forming enzyme family protein n=1 Tax=Bauldia sp. TaxID=2575872 RepID=UPI001DACBF39|nr:AMP-binding protein [Bauldia sp.]MCB1497627.1 AMP-binding protein [Bauldia sp.]
MPGRIPIPERFNLARHCLEQSAAAQPGKVALTVVGDVAAGPGAAEYWTYGDLDRAVRGVAAGLEEAGLAPGDRLLLRLPNNSSYALLFYGAIAAGLVPIPVSSMLTERDIAFLLADSGAAGIAMDDGLVVPLAGVAAKVFDTAAIDRLRRSDPRPGYADTAAGDPAYMIYTSGTSGRPKGVVHAQRVALGRIPMHRDWQAIGGDDVMLHAGTFNWSYTLGVGLLDPWSVGAAAVLYNGPQDIQVWPRLIRLAGATLFAAVPLLYRQMLKHAALDPADFATIRHCLCAGEAMHPSILEQWRAATGRALYESLGMSECSTFISSGPSVPVRPGSAGKPQQTRRIAILAVDGDDTPLPTGETGLLAIHRSDPGLMLGYWNRPEEDAATTRGDWFVGGDLAAFDDDGYVWYHGRADDIMNAGGFRVSPLEVEAALADCPGVAEVAVTEHRVDDTLSVIAAYVVARPGSGIDADRVLAHAGGRLAAYKRPKQVFFVESLPRNVNGKLQRRALG